MDITHYAPAHYGVTIEAAAAESGDIKNAIRPEGRATRYLHLQCLLSSRQSGPVHSYLVPRSP